jgi:5-methylthioribose kinase
MTDPRAGPRPDVPPGYRPLTIEDVPAYVREHPHLSALVPSDPLHVAEVGDGNLNLVFIVRDDLARPGVVLKQSLPWVRVFGEGWPLTIERARREANAYAVHTRFAGATNPVLHGFDETRYVIAMEDLADLRIWRGALDDGEIHAGAAAALGTFMARVAFHTSDVGMEPAARKALMARTINPEMCGITEDLVLTEPLRVHEHNRFDPALDGDVAALRADEVALDALATLKHRFLTHTEALIHGDLHTGSVMVGGGRTVAIDPEFAAYGPIGFDLGTLWANSVFARARAMVLGRPAGFQAHLRAIVPESWAAFTDELRRLWPERLDRSFTDGMRETWIATTRDDALGFAGAEAIRRMIGFAHVSDIETLPEPDRVRATRAILAVGHELLTGRARIADIDAFETMVANVLARHLDGTAARG